MSVTLTYFPVSARGLQCVLMLELHGFEWEGNVMTLEKWPEVKATGKAPFGQLPMMETPDIGAIAQGNAIMRYLGLKKGAEGNGKDLKEQVVSEELACLAEDYYRDLLTNQPTILVKEKAAAGREKMWAETFPARLACLEKLAAGNDKFTDSGITYGEIALFSVLHQMVQVKSSVLDAYPAVKSFHARFVSSPVVKAVLEGKSKVGDILQFFVEA